MNNDAPRTLSDKRSRTNLFVELFGDRHLNDVTLDEIKEAIADDDFGTPARIFTITNHRTHSMAQQNAEANNSVPVSLSSCHSSRSVKTVKAPSPSQSRGN
jgi:hypothetical protein